MIIKRPAPLKWSGFSFLMDQRYWKWMGNEFGGEMVGEMIIQKNIKKGIRNEWIQGCLNKKEPTGLLNIMQKKCTSNDGRSWFGRTGSYQPERV
ncbi:hypothetical protein JS81_02790 [Thermoactinomyces sp. Gus2-1]|nr:hypothetical protein JS81_02790 [Thermoactinomyces sp. Gus2-1]